MALTTQLKEVRLPRSIYSGRSMNRPFPEAPCSCTISRTFFSDRKTEAWLQTVSEGIEQTSQHQKPGRGWHSGVLRLGHLSS